MSESMVDGMRCRRQLINSMDFPVTRMPLACKRGSHPCRGQSQSSVFITAMHNLAGPSQADSKMQDGTCGLRPKMKRWNCSLSA